MKRRVLTGGLLLVLLLVVAVLVVVTSSTVARYAVNRAATAVPGLSLEYEQGNLWRGIAVTDLRYQASGLAVTAARAEVRWSLHCLVSGLVCLDRVAADQVTVEVTPTPTPGETGSAVGQAMPALPVEILFREVVLNGLQVSTPEADVSVMAITLRGRLTNAGLSIARARVRQPLIRLPETGGTSGGGSMTEGPIELPAFKAPLPVDVERLQIEHPVLEMAEARYEARWLRFAGRLAGSSLRIGGLELEHARGRVRLAGRLELTGDYPLDANLNATLPGLYQGRDQRLNAVLTGNLAELGLRLRLDGLVSAKVDGRVEPLSPQLPYSLTVRTQAIGWPLTAEAPQVRGTDVRLRLKGDLNAYSLTGSGGLSGAVTPAVDWQLETRGDWKGADIERLEVAGLEGTLQASGRVSWQPEITWQAQVSVEGVQLDQHWPRAPSDFSGEATVQGAVTDKGWRLAVDTPGLTATYRGEPLALTGSVSHSTAGVWQFSGLRLTNGDNRITGSGRLDGGLSATVSLHLPELGRWVPGLGGMVAGTVTAAGPLSTPDIEADLRGRGLTYQELKVGEAEIEGRIAGLATAASRVVVRVGNVAYNKQHLDNLRLEASGTRRRHQLNLRASGEGAAVELDFAGGLTASLNWDGRLTDGAVAWEERRWLLQSPASLTFDSDTLRARMAGHCWARQSTRLCLAEPAVFGPGGHVALELVDMPLGWLSQWLPQGFRWRGRLSGEARADWAPERAPRINASLLSRDGSLTVYSGDAATEGDPALPLGYERLSVDARLDAQRLQARVELESQTLGAARVDVRVRHASADRPLDGTVEVEGINLTVLEPFFPRIETLKGELALSGRLDGRVSSPAFNGEITLRGGEIQGPELPMHLEGLSVTVGVTGRQFTIDGGFTSGEGQAELSGDGGWDTDGWRLNAELTGERLRVVYPPLATLQVSPDLNLQARPGEVEVTGTIRVPQGHLTLKQLPKGGVPYSNDVVVVRGPGAVTREQKQDGEALRISTRIEVVLGDEVRFSGLGAEGRLTGALRLRQIGAATAEATGEIRIVDASFEAYGQKLDIRSGRLIFAGPVTEPLVEIEAVRRIDNIVVGLRVEGPAAQPEVTLFSEPPMPEEQILAYLVTGRAYGEAGPGEEAAMAQAAVALGVFTSRGAASEIASELGVQDFQLAAEGEGEGAQVTVSGYIAPNLLVKYGVGVFTPNNTLTLRYNLTRNIYLEAVSGLESAIDAFYSFSF